MAMVPRELVNQGNSVINGISAKIVNGCGELRPFNKEW